MKSLVLPVLGKHPEFGINCKLAPGAIVVGDVKTGDNCSFWFHSVVRGDVDSIRIGNGVNVQDHAVIHCTYKQAPVAIGDRVSIGHRAVVHGCTIENDVLIGMGAIVMDHVHIESGVIVGAGSVVTERSRLESGYIYAGVPARKVKAVSAEHAAHLLSRISENYSMYASWYGSDFTDGAT
jgi:carbonic anhydrase/acetyltransferase-like protein (isoleucine patch superfamily)